MSGYSEMARDAQQRAWLTRWVPEDDSALVDCPEDFRDQYRFALARAREAKHELAEIKKSLADFRRLIGTGWL